MIRCLTVVVVCCWSHFAKIEPPKVDANKCTRLTRTELSVNDRITHFIRMMTILHTTLFIKQISRWPQYVRRTCINERLTIHSVRLRLNLFNLILIKTNLFYRFIFLVRAIIFIMMIVNTRSDNNNNNRGVLNSFSLPSWCDHCSHSYEPRQFTFAHPFRCGGGGGRSFLGETFSVSLSLSVVLQSKY